MKKSLRRLIVLILGIILLIMFGAIALLNFYSKNL